MRSSSSLVGLGCAFVVALGACGSSPDPSEVTVDRAARGVSRAAALTKPGTTVPAGTWGYVEQRGTAASGKTVTAVKAYKVLGVERGKAGSLRDVRFPDAGTGVDVDALRRAAPYFVEVETTTVRGDPDLGVPQPSLVPADGESLAQVSVDTALTRCDQRRFVSGVGKESRICLVALTPGGSGPRTAELGTGRQVVQFALPAVRRR